MKAVLIREVGKADVLEIPERPSRPGYSKVRTVALAINPSSYSPALRRIQLISIADFDHTASAGLIYGILGCDFSGIVEEIGSNCPNTDVKVGDRVYGVCHGANLETSEDGAFIEVAMVRDGHLAKIPDHLSFEDAATQGVTITSVGQALYMTLELPLPTEPAQKPFPILIYGGSTANGTLAIQYAKLSGLTVVTTASPKNFDLVRSRGADVVFDYHDPDCGQKIRDYTKNSLAYVFDTISTESSYKICAEALPSESANVDARTILAYTTFGEAFSKFGMNLPPIRQHFDFGVKFWKLHAQLLAEGKVKPHPVAIRSGGLYSIPSGIREISEGAVSGCKLVYRVGDTASADLSGENSANQPALQRRDIGDEW